MDLTNKQVSIEMLQSTTYPPETTAKVIVKEQLTESVSKVIGTYELKFYRVYPGSDEAALLADIQEQLATIPE